MKFRLSFQRSCLVFALIVGAAGQACSADFEELLRPRFRQHCVKCHGGAEPNGDVDLNALKIESELLGQPRLIQEIIEVLGANDMPPQDEPPLPDEVRRDMVASLKRMLRKSAADQPPPSARIRRLNRFQYNHAVKDLFQLKRDVFPLPEKLMTRHDNYLASPGTMPDRVQVSSLTLNPPPGLSQVRAFPKDLRAAHGFDNQSNQLTLSPLLLDAFLRLSVSIVESPDFTPANVGIWEQFFQAPESGNPVAEFEKRLAPFLRRAFRTPADDSTLQRYVRYAKSRHDAGLDFTRCMKKVASAVLSSPMFLYRYRTPSSSDFDLASDLSFFLWSSGPDDELLDLAEKGQLSDPAIFQASITRMLKDPKIERFLDTFPAQWMQLENVMAATPDPQQHQYYRLEKSHPASLQMVLEPLLLFDAIFLENRPLRDLITPDFGYRSEFLRTWYTHDLRPPQVDAEKILQTNRRNDQRRQELRAALKSGRNELQTLTQPIRDRILQQRKATDQKPIDLKPFAAWEFNGDLQDSVGQLHLDAHGKVEFRDGLAYLNKAYLLSKPMTMDLKAKSLEVWCKLHNLDQRGGGVMGIQGPGDFFDTIVIGERKPRHWISGSNGFRRTEDFPESTAEEKVDELLHLVMTYTEDGDTTLYREGKPYGKPYRKGPATFPKNRTSVIFGLRHLPAGGNRYLTVSIDRARFYNRTLSAEEVAAAYSGNNLFVSSEELAAAMSTPQRQRWSQGKQNIARLEKDLDSVPANRDIAQVRAEANRRFEEEMRNKVRSRVFQRVAEDDPRYGGVITNAAMFTMTSGPKRTHPIARGAWIIEVIFNDPPPPPPNDVPPLNEDDGGDQLTIREKFAKHRENPDCAGCHSRLDPLGFAMENFGVTGRWRDRYDNGRRVDASGRMMRKHEFRDVTQFKAALVSEQKRFAKAFTSHLLRFAVARELTPADFLVVDDIVAAAANEQFRLQTLIREVALQLGKIES